MLGEKEWGRPSRLNPFAISQGGEQEQFFLKIGISLAVWASHPS
jgi:hypothetical protein